MDHHHPDGADAFFARAGLLNERLTIAHGVHLRRSEVQAFRDAGVTLILNTSSNLRLASGVADGSTIAALGLRVGIGLDGMAFDDDADMLREVRLASRLLGPRGDANPGLDRLGILRAAFSDGRVAHDGMASPGLKAGADADLLMLSLEAVAGDRLDDDMATVAELAFGRWRRGAVRDVYVGGRRIIADGRLVGIDLAAAEAELTAAARSARSAAPPPDWVARARAARVAASR
jgi:cytosine/adenosine deaminase-related metal-dependent hydrolase